MKVDTQSVISRENYDSIKNMLLSNDESSVMMAFSILEQSDYENSKVYILCMIAQTHSHVLAERNHKFLESNYPDLYKSLYQTMTDELGISQSSNISFKNIYTVARTRGNQEEIQFMIDVLSEQFKSLLLDYGMSFMEYFDIELKPKKV